MNDLNFADFLLWEASLRSTLLVRKQYVDMAGGFKAGAVLGRMVYYYLPDRNGGPNKLRVRKDGEYWIAKSREEWQTETFLTKKEFDRAMKELVDRGLVRKKTFHFSGVPTLHVRLVTDRFLEELVEVLSATSITAASFFDELSEDVSPDGEEKAVAPIEDTGPRCPECGSNKVVEEKYDPNGRCAYCLLLAAWAYYFPPSKKDDSGNILKLGKPQPKIGTQSLRKMAETRWKDGTFRQLYRVGLERASGSHNCKTQSWFGFKFLVENDSNYMKMQPDGFWMEWKDELDGKSGDSGPDKTSAQM